MSLTRPIPFPYKWAESGEKIIVPDSGADHSKGKADLLGGFPKQTMIPLSQGGQPPWGTDHNGILNRITEGLQWVQSGGTAIFDQNFCDKINGYSHGAIIQDVNDATTLWFSLIDNNIFNPANQVQTINGIAVNRSDYWKQFSLADIDDIKARLKSAEETIINHTGRLDNYGDAINRIFNIELPSKAALNGNSGQDFNAKNINAFYVESGGLKIHGGVLQIDAYLSDIPGYVRSWGINQIPNDNNILQFIGFDKDNPATDGMSSIFIEFQKQNSSYNGVSTVTITQTLIAPKKGDLSELYKADSLDYQPGQVMMFGGANEVTKCVDKKYAFGIYSTDPAYILNGDRSKYHIPIALTGRVPVLVEGPLTKDDHITATNKGTAIASQDPSDIWLGRPIKLDDRTDLRLVECFVRAVV